MKLYFNGGPVDGYSENNPVSEYNLPEQFGIIVSPSMIRSLTGGNLRGYDTNPTSLALYELHVNACGVAAHYRYIGSTTPDEAKDAPLWQSPSSQSR